MEFLPELGSGSYATAEWRPMGYVARGISGLEVDPGVSRAAMLLLWMLSWAGAIV